ncbi:MAG: His/Gly/Thr/Pro-type tRNA ligase C-terminal domain-containing protein, partial [Cyclobacteriaceae bacterium]|nr:His/Gly/Thr/Pro-type tRNA ligase C-terminal domain-containing protein [Cyclobacteriaceae bacterium]
RGLAYYTGMIFEVKINNVSIGSVSGGGRYDNLTGIFGVEGVPGTGFSFGVDRLYDAMDELNLFPEEALTSSKVLIAHFDDEAMIYGYGILSRLRENDIASEVYPDRHKIKKQLTYANKKGTPYVVIVGSDEMNSGQLTVKNMVSGDEEKLTVDELIKHIA